MLAVDQQQQQQQRHLLFKTRWVLKLIQLMGPCKKVSFTAKVLLSRFSGTDLLAYFGVGSFG